MSRTATALALLPLLALAPEALRAQACVGLPNGPGEVAAAATFEVDDTAPDTASGMSPGLGGVGGEVGYAASGAPVSARAGYGVLNVDSVEVDEERGSASAAVELGGGSSSICAVAGVARGLVDGASAASGPGSYEQTVWEVPVGVGVSRTIQPTGSLTVSPYLFPHAVYRNVTVDRTVADSTVTSSGSDYSGRASFGVVVSGSTFWARLSSGVDVPVGEGAELRPLGAVTFGLLF